MAAIFSSSLPILWWYSVAGSGLSLSPFCEGILYWVRTRVYWFPETHERRLHFFDSSVVVESVALAVFSGWRSVLWLGFGRGSLAALAPFQQSSVLWGSPHVLHFGLLFASSLLGPLFRLVCCYLSHFIFLHSSLKWKSFYSESKTPFWIPYFCLLQVCVLFESELPGVYIVGRGWLRLVFLAH